MDTPPPIVVPNPVVMVQPAAPRTPVVVTVTAAGWRCEYKGAVCVFPSSMEASEVKTRAGEWGRAVDTPPPDVPPPPSPFPAPFRLGTVCAPGG